MFSPFLFALQHLTESLKIAVECAAPGSGAFKNKVMY